MSPRATRAGRLWHRLRNPPIGYQHGRRSRFVRNFPMVCWVYYWLVAHTTPRLYLFAAAGLGPTLLLLLVGFENRVLPLGFAALAWIAVSVVAGLLWRPRLEVAVHTPARVECGSRFETRYTVRNLRRRSARDLAVDTLIFSDWMSLRRGRAHLAYLPPGASETLSAEGMALARGVYTLPALRYDSAFPCGFWRWGRTDPRERRLSVYPRYARLASLDIPLGTRNRQEFSAARELAREALEFHGCREFREGDALRHVHPRSSARLGVPVVKEFQAEGRSRTAVLVDTHEGGARERLRAALARESPVEAALSLAAAAADALSSTDRVLELLVAGPDIYRFVSQGRVGYLEAVLDILAAVEPSRNDPLDRLEPLLLDEIHAIQSVCLILTGWDRRREALARALDAWGVGLKIVLLTGRGAMPAGMPPEAVCVPVRDVLRGEVSAL
jgi:uncharacterized protein (DUF58 family)